MALLATEARRILLDAETPLSTFAPGLGIETDVGSMRSKHGDSTSFLSLFSRACALYEQTRVKECYQFDSAPSTFCVCSAIILLLWLDGRTDRAQDRNHCQVFHKNSSQFEM